MIEPGPRDMPVHGIDGPNLMVEYINASMGHSGRAYFVAITDCGTIRAVPAPVPVVTPVNAESCKEYSSAAEDAGIVSGSNAEKTRIRNLLGL